MTSKLPQNTKWMLIWKITTEKGRQHIISLLYLILLNVHTIQNEHGQCWRKIANIADFVPADYSVVATGICSSSSFLLISSLVKEMDMTKTVKVVL